ncbi:IseA DL-endopeptidase inhibitor family protein [Priestia megaterium]|uniref:IseA DL-endopeptidase inhibitor family protein n=1 Tax=Priestia megaterium TaxID=1404 RepID=UPI00203E525C|nr:IseA DL-endopeptidase inhibitor family protein [Priestia megaterium]MCM3796396.1 IseA DL-endopeptidase inhibitor family protein [Priestia megaterium]
MKKIGLVLSSIAIFFTLSTGVTAQTTSTTLTDANAAKIAASASNHFWSALHGYKNKPCTERTFEYKGTDYVYLCPEFDTKAELSSYLSETFTNSAVEKGLTNYGYITYNGKLAHPIGDGFSMLEWSKAKTKLVYQTATVRSYEFTVPTVDGGSVKRTVTFYKSNSQWKVNKFDAVQ